MGQQQIVMWVRITRAPSVDPTDNNASHPDYDAFNVHGFDHLSRLSFSKRMFIPHAATDEHLSGLRQVMRLMESEMLITLIGVVHDSTISHMEILYGVIVQDHDSRLNRTAVEADSLDGLLAGLHEIAPEQFLQFRSE